MKEQRRKIVIVIKHLTESRFEEEIRNISCDITVYVDSMRKLKKGFFDKSSHCYSSNTMGFFVKNNDEDNEYPEMFIFINQNLPLYQKMTVFFHEAGHYLCEKKKCCCKKSKIKHLSEVHAMKYDLKQCLDKRFVRSLEYTFNQIQVFSNETNKINNPLYHKAAKVVMRSKLWLECDNFLAIYHGCQIPPKPYERKKSILRRFSHKIKNFIVSRVFVKMS